MSASGGGRRGRRAGKPETRAEILEVARRHFLEAGYQGVTMRGVAREAGVDQALVAYYFGSKKGLFGAALALAVNPPELMRTVLAGDLATFPERVLGTVLSVWDDPELGQPLRMLVASAAHEPEILRLLREVVQSEMAQALADAMGGADASARAGAVAIQIAGLIVMRYWLQMEPVASMSVDDVVRYAAPGLHAAMRGPGRRPPRAGVSSGSSAARR